MASKKTKTDAVSEPKETVKKTKGAYSIEILVNGQSSKNNGADILDALTKFDLPDFIKTDVLIRVTNKDKSVESFMNTQKARRIFSGGGTPIKLLAINLQKLLG